MKLADLSLQIRWYFAYWKSWRANFLIDDFNFHLATYLVYNILT